MPPPETPRRSITCSARSIWARRASKALQWAAWLQKEFAAGLTLLHVARRGRRALAGRRDTLAHSSREAVAEELDRLQQFAGCPGENRLSSRRSRARYLRRRQPHKGPDVLVIGRGSAAGVFGRLRTNADPSSGRRPAR